MICQTPTPLHFSLLSDANLSQHVTCPTQVPGNHILDLLITSTDSSLNAQIVQADTCPADHYPFFSHLSISPNPPPAPQSQTFRRLHRTDHDSFLNDLKQTSLVTDPPVSRSTPRCLRHHPSQPS